MKRCLLILCCLENVVLAQEASSGFELRTTLSGAAAYSPRLEAAPRSGAPLTGGFRSVLYPTWKLNIILFRIFICKVHPVEREWVVCH